MKNVGLALTLEDMARIASAVLTMSVVMADDAKDEEDVKEAFELTKLHVKLNRLIMAGIEHASDED